MVFLLARLTTENDLKLVTKRKKTVRVRELGSVVVPGLVALSW